MLDDQGLKLSAEGAKYLRAVLLDNSESLHYAAATINKVVTQLSDELGVTDKTFRRVLTEFAFQRILRNMLIVFKHNRSPIERQFLGALVIGTSTQYPFGFLITPPSTDAEQFTVEYAEGRSDYEVRRAAILERLSDKSDLAFLNECIVQLNAGTLAPDDAQALAAETYIRTVYDVRYTLHATPQARLPEIKVEGSVVIPDLMVWIPLRKDFRVIAECDGFKWHSDKEHFINDRIRSRTLKFAGYDVHRYSGSEIHADAISASKDFHDHLLLAISKLHPPLEQIKRSVSDAEVQAIFVGAAAVLSAAEDPTADGVRGLGPPRLAC
jgi:very-short-patch-repair endonuclease